MENSRDKWIQRIQEEKKRPITPSEKDYVKSVIRSMIGLKNGGDQGKLGKAGYAVMQVSEFGIDEEVEKKPNGVIDKPPKPHKSLKEISKIHKVDIETLKKQLKKGIKVETEHTNDLDQAEIIALQHLEELPDYYDKLEKIEENHKKLENEKTSDEEFYMARNELSQIQNAVKRLNKKLGNKEGQLPAWVQSKITKAADYIDTAADYLTSDTEEIEEALSPEVERIANKLPEEDFKKRYGKRWKQVKIATAQNIAKKKMQEELDPTIQPRQQLIAAQKRLAQAKQKQLQQQKKMEQQTGQQPVSDTVLEYFANYVRENGSLSRVQVNESFIDEQILIDENFESGFMPLEEARIAGNGRAYDVVFRYHNKVQTVSFFVACDQRPSKSEMQYMVNMFYPNASLLMFTPARETRDNMVLVTAPHKMGKVVYQKEDWEPLTEDESDELDMILEEGEKLGKITRTPGGPKKFMVKVKDPSTGNIKTVRFGDPNLEIKRDDPERRKSFRARHKCDNPGPRTKARYWACRTWEKNKSVSDLTD
jgi:hypothetical protein